tara:strand:- start:367 stop:1026 length:660 start_codon:yes stop_codon:yes gene_type:complete
MICNKIPDIIKTAITETHYISPKELLEASNIYYKFTEEIATKISSNKELYGDIDTKQLMECIPVPEFKIKTFHKVKLTSDNWQSCESKKDLKNLKLTELKAILKEHNINITGNKTSLINCVWGILHPETIDTFPYIDNKSEKHTEDILESLNEMRKIYIGKNNKIMDDSTTSKTTMYKYHPVKNWVFLETTATYEFIGSLKNNKLIKSFPPIELRNLYQ